MSSYGYFKERYPLLAEQLNQLPTWTTRDVRAAHMAFTQALMEINTELTNRALQYREQVLQATNGRTIMQLDRYFQSVYPPDPASYCKFWEDMYRSSVKTFTPTIEKQNYAE